MGEETQSNPEAEASPKKGGKGKFVLLIGAVFIAVGCFIAHRPLVKPTVKTGDAAIDWQFTSSAQQTSLSKLWQKGPVVVIWLRHFG
jgi:hypothetical protein